MPRWNLDSSAVTRTLLWRNARSLAEIPVETSNLMRVRSLSRISSFSRLVRARVMPPSQELVVFGCLDIYLRIYDVQYFIPMVGAAVVVEGWWLANS